MQPKKIVKAFVQIHTPASLALRPEAEILNVLVNTKWDTRMFVADVVVNVSCHSREEISFGSHRCEWDSIYLANTIYVEFCIHHLLIIVFKGER